MKERPILFSGPMVRAILEGRKTQTRRVVKPQPSEPVTWGCIGGKGFGFIAGDEMLRCPYGVPGDRLWVRESFSYDARWRYEWWQETGERPDIWYWADGNPTDGDWTKPKPSIHMPRSASRITLEVKSVRVERLQDITPEDAEAEGIDEFMREKKLGGYYTTAFSRLWESINGPGSWEQNPWVWVIEFSKEGKGDE